MIFFFNPDYDVMAVIFLFIVAFAILSFIVQVFSGSDDVAGQPEPEWDAEQKRDWAAHDREKRYWKAVMDRQDKPKRYYLDDLWRL